MRAHVQQLQDRLIKAEAEREELRRQLIDLQIQIAELLPAHDGDRANDPIIRRVERVAFTLRDLIAYDDGISQREETYEIDDAQHAFDKIRWLMTETG